MILMSRDPAGIQSSSGPFFTKRRRIYPRMHAYKQSDDKIEANSSQFEHVGIIQHMVSMHVLRLTCWNRTANFFKLAKDQSSIVLVGGEKVKAQCKLRHNNKQITQPTIYKLHLLLQNLAGKSKTWLNRGHGRKEKGTWCEWRGMKPSYTATSTNAGPPCCPPQSDGISRSSCSIANSELSLHLLLSYD